MGTSLCYLQCRIPCIFYERLPDSYSLINNDFSGGEQCSILQVSLVLVLHLVCSLQWIALAGYVKYDLFLLLIEKLNSSGSCLNRLSYVVLQVGMFNDAKAVISNLWGESEVDKAIQEFQSVIKKDGSDLDSQWLELLEEPHSRGCIKAVY